MVIEIMQIHGQLMSRWLPNRVDLRTSDSVGVARASTSTSLADSIAISVLLVGLRTKRIILFSQRWTSILVAANVFSFAKRYD